MKPIIIIKEKNTKGKFELTEKELKELIEQAYGQGVEDGKPCYTFWSTTSPEVIPNNIGTTTPNYPRDAYGNPIPYCNGTTTAVPNTKFNDLVYRGWEHNIKFPKQGEPIPCGLSQTGDGATTLGNLPDYCSTAIGTADSTVLKGFSNQPNEDTYKGEQSR